MDNLTSIQWKSGRMLAQPGGASTIATHRLSSPRYNRRRFLQQTGAAIAATTFASASSPTTSSLAAASPNERVNLAAVGVGGKGWTDINQAARGQNVVAFCDVETGAIRRNSGFGAAARQWPMARRYTDWRVMLDKEHQKSGRHYRFNARSGNEFVPPRIEQQLLVDLGQAEERAPAGWLEDSTPATQPLGRGKLQETPTFG